MGLSNQSKVFFLLFKGFKWCRYLKNDLGLGAVPMQKIHLSIKKRKKVTCFG
jgi:hypothetical protein